MLMQELRCRTDSRMIERSRLASFPELARLVSSPQETNRTFVSTATTTTRKHNAYGWHRRASLRSACRPCGQARTTRSSPRCSRDVRDPDATSTSRARSARRWRLDRHGQRSCHNGRWCAILGTLKVPSVAVGLVTLNITIIPAQEALLVDANHLTPSPRGGCRF